MFRHIIEEIPDEILKLTKLVEINLSQNQISQLDIDFSRFRSIKDLNLSNNILAHFPHINQTSFINTIDISHNRLNVMKVKAQNLVELRKLAINNNEIEQISPELMKISTLFDIIIDSSQADKIAKNPFLHREVHTKLQII